VKKYFRFLKELATSFFFFFVPATALEQLIATQAATQMV
jgi:hypothetical protein